MPCTTAWLGALAPRASRAQTKVLSCRETERAKERDIGSSGSIIYEYTHCKELHDILCCLCVCMCVCYSWVCVLAAVETRTMTSSAVASILFIARKLSNSSRFIFRALAKISLRLCARPSVSVLAAIESRSQLATVTKTKQECEQISLDKTIIAINEIHFFLPTQSRQFMALTVVKEKRKDV